ncbi:hypothetical protein Pint_14463 [Pistacia integerrima]|uniref:Uncharacterized protein n=1 Tax=Pistacia integerrima TaxID=434235 RepID=A0ACC0Y9T8_9ROSI|nr:hypothetical protein Pint_14463 [Pistacia integerrima]
MILHIILALLFLENAVTEGEVVKLSMLFLVRDRKDKGVCRATIEILDYRRLRFGQCSVLPCVLNIVFGYGPTAGAPLANHMDMD